MCSGLTAFLAHSSLSNFALFAGGEDAYGKVCLIRGEFGIDVFDGS